jgi:hypothetical protein
MNPIALSIIIPVFNGVTFLKRIQVRDSLWTDADVELARTSLGTVKRAGHVRLQQVKNVKG